MPGPAVLRRVALSSTAGLGVALLGLSFHGMTGLDTRLAAAAQSRDAWHTQLVADRHDGAGAGCAEREGAEPAAAPDMRDF